MANRLADWWKRIVRSFQGMTPEEFIGARTAARRDYSVSADSAMRNAAVWACISIRAGLISTFPLDVFRKIEDSRVSVETPKILLEPGGSFWDYVDWMYATQVDLDRYGNTYGLIVGRDGQDRPAMIELVSAGSVTVVVKPDGKIIYRIGNAEYTPDQVWHERQNVVAGLPVGLSPVAYAASVLSEEQSISEFAKAWFGRKAIPAAHIRNTETPLLPESAGDVKQRYLTTMGTGEPWVTGSDWEYNALQAEQMGMEWLEDRKHSATEIAQFFGVPADLIGAQASGQSLTYANLTERNLQFLIFHLGPVVARREKNLSKLLARGQFVKLNVDALLRMDPLNRAKALALQLEWRYLTNSEARALEDRKPLTAADKEEFDTLYGAGAQGKSPLALTDGGNKNSV